MASEASRKPVRRRTAAAKKRSRQAAAGGTGGRSSDPPVGPPPAAGGYSRSAKSAKAFGAAAPLAVAAVALLVAEPERAVPAVPNTPLAERMAAAGGTAPPALTGQGDLPPAPPDSVPAGCLDQFGIDLPHHRGDDVRRRQTMICRRGYVLSFNLDTRNPDWVLERLEPADLTGPARRGNRFLDDPALGANLDADSSDYLRTGFDRGHQAPAADAKFDQVVMDESFYFTNMSPQRGIGMNRGAWKYLEEATRSWVLCGGHPDLYVITGPIYGNHPGNPPTIGSPPVAVPWGFYKIVYDPNLGRAVGFVLPNTRIGSRIDLQDYVVPIAEIETATGLNFFRSMDGRRQTILKDSAGLAWANPGPCPGDSGD